MKYVILILSVLFVGCTSNRGRVVSTPAVKKSSLQCKTVGKKVGKYSSVMVRRNCLKKGRSEVVILLHAVKFAPMKDKLTVAKKGIEESARLMLSILEFKPKLAAMAITTVNGIPCYVFLITGSAED